MRIDRHLILISAAHIYENDDRATRQLNQNMKLQEKEEEMEENAKAYCWTSMFYPPHIGNESVFV